MIDLNALRSTHSNHLEAAVVALLSELRYRVLVRQGSEESGPMHSADRSDEVIASAREKAGRLAEMRDAFERLVSGT